jgi:hypothetical protein
MADTKIPEMHSGHSYYEFMSFLSQKRSVRRYFEIGVNEGKLMSFIHADLAVGVDPEFVLSSNVAAHKNETHLIRKTSDRFFQDIDFKKTYGGPPELCFLDGYHTFEFLLRDFMNTEAICSSASLICMHDCLPLDEIMAIRRMSAWSVATIGTKYQGAWTGDVWKVIPILQRYRPDLKLVMASSPPTGVVCVTNLNCNDTTLRTNYLEIVKEFSKINSSREEIENFYGKIHMTNTADILDEMDNTLHFLI